MGTNTKFGLKWHRLILAALITVVMANTAPYPHLAPLLQTLANRMQPPIGARSGG